MADRRFPIIDLASSVEDGKIIVEVGEASNSGCSGTLTVIVHGEGGCTLSRKVDNLNRMQQTLSFEAPSTKKMHPVTASLQLDSGEIKVDNEILKL